MKRLIFGIILFFPISALLYAQNGAACREISILGPTGVTRPGDVMTFTALVNKLGETDEVKYVWTVSAGTIEKGQGTPVIEVRTTKAMADSNVTATVRIPDVAAECRQSASETGSIGAIGRSIHLDEFGKLAGGSVKARIDNLYMRLNYDPDSEGVISVLVDKRQKRASKISYLNGMYAAIIFRKYDPARVTFMIYELADDYAPNTKFWIVPPGADYPDGWENPIVIRGEEFSSKVKTLFLRK